MEREGERPRIQGKSLNATSRRERSGERVLSGRRFLGIFLTAVLVAGLLPLVPVESVPGVSVVEEAQALEGTTNYGDFFTIGHRDGQPGSITGNRLVAGRTDYSWAYEYRSSRWASSSAFVSKKQVSLTSDI